MGIYRYRSTGVSQEIMQRLEELGLTVGSIAPVTFVDINLETDSLQPDLDIIMNSYGFVFDSINPPIPPQMQLISPDGYYYSVSVTDTGLISTSGATGGLLIIVYLDILE